MDSPAMATKKKILGRSVFRQGQSSYRIGLKKIGRGKPVPAKLEKKPASWSEGEEDQVLKFVNQSKILDQELRSAFRSIERFQRRAWSKKRNALTSYLGKKKFKSQIADIRRVGSRVQDFLENEDLQALVGLEDKEAPKFSKLKNPTCPCGSSIWKAQLIKLESDLKQVQRRLVLLMRRDQRKSGDQAYEKLDSLWEGVLKLEAKYHPDRAKKRRA